MGHCIGKIYERTKRGRNRSKFIDTDRFEELSVKIRREKIIENIVSQ